MKLRHISKKELDKILAESRLWESDKTEAKKADFTNIFRTIENSPESGFKNINIYYVDFTRAKLQVMGDSLLKIA